MNSTTTSMSGRPILAPENWSLQELLNAGWSEEDLAWEATAERTVDAAAKKDTIRAKDEAGEALRLARSSFEPIDPRLGTSLANFGISLSLAGDNEGYDSLIEKALEGWRSAPLWISRMEAPRVARSSLFHLRMESLHRDTYRTRWQKRWNEIAADATRRLSALAANEVDIVTPETGITELWRRERPAMLNDTRKLMAAASLLLAPQVKNGR